MRDSEIVCQALFDAIGWQAGLVEAWPDGSAEQQEARDQIKAYRRLLKRRYGSDCTKLDAALKEAKLVNPLTMPRS